MAVDVVANNLAELEERIGRSAGDDEDESPTVGDLRSAGTLGAVYQSLAVPT